MFDAHKRPNVLPWPPMIYVSAVALGYGLEWFQPFVALDRLLASAPRWMGLVLMAGGLAVDLSAMWALHRARTTVRPDAATATLVSSGIYGWSRNPIYLGNTIALAGIALGLRWGWLMLLVPVTVAGVTAFAIVREEKHLDLNFGAAWRDYAARVRRWV